MLGWHGNCCFDLERPCCNGENSLSGCPAGGPNEEGSAVMDCFTFQMEATELKRLHSEMMAGVGGEGQDRAVRGQGDMYWAAPRGWDVPGHCEGNPSAGDREGSAQRALREQNPNGSSWLCLQRAA